MNRLKLLRTEKGESLGKIAHYLNVTIQTISNYENEKRDMSPDTIIKLAEYFGVTTDYLLGKTEIRNAEEANFQFAFHKDIDTKGLTDEDIKEALEIYRILKSRKDKEEK